MLRLEREANTLRCSMEQMKSRMEEVRKASEISQQQAERAASELSEKEEKLRDAVEENSRLTEELKGHVRSSRASGELVAAKSAQIVEEIKKAEASHQLSQQSALELSKLKEKLDELAEENMILADENARIAEELSKLHERADTESLASTRASTRLRVVMHEKQSVNTRKERHASIKEHPKVIVIVQIWWVTALATRTPDIPIPDGDAYQLESD
eukprot:2491257-Prymnesium_polylepis.1